MGANIEVRLNIANAVASSSRRAGEGDGSEPVAVVLTSMEQHT